MCRLSSILVLLVMLLLVFAALPPRHVRAQANDRTRTFKLVDAVKKMTFQYHKEKPKQPGEGFSKYRHKELYDEATWKRKARWQRKLRMRKTCTGKLREVEKVHSIKGEGTVVTVVRGKNIEKYWVAPFRSKRLGGLGAGDKYVQVSGKLGEPYKATRSVWAYACKAFGAKRGGSGWKEYSECLRVYFQDAAVIAVKYFVKPPCDIPMPARGALKTKGAPNKAKSFVKAAIKGPPVKATRIGTFKGVDAVKKMTRQYHKEKPKDWVDDHSRYMHRKDLFFNPDAWKGMARWKRKLRVRKTCKGRLREVEEARQVPGEGMVVTVIRGRNWEKYWVGSFRSKTLKGIGAGDSREKVIATLGKPFRQTRGVLAFACLDYAAERIAGEGDFSECLRVYLQGDVVIAVKYFLLQVCTEPPVEKWDASTAW